MTEKEIVSFRMMLSLANALTLSPFEVQQLVTRTETVLNDLTTERDRLKEALVEIRGMHSVNALIMDIVERALQEAGDE